MRAKCDIVDELGDKIRAYFPGKRVVGSRLKHIGTLEDWINLAKQNWDLLQELHDNLIDIWELDELLEREDWTKWDFYSMMIGESNSRLERQ